MRNALYFPYISVPSERWTTHMLLYWERLSSIVPFDYIEDPDLLHPFMRDLVEEGLVAQVVPSQFLGPTDIWTPFIHYVESKVEFLRRSSPQTAPVQLHFEKMGYELVNFLKEQDLANDSDYPWYNVDRRIANWYMAYLATTLGSLDSVNAAPVTDDLSLIASLADGVVRQPRNAVHRAKARRVLLEGLLPVPEGRVDVHSLAEFKREHGSLLNEFRVMIEAKVAELAAIDDPGDRETATIAFQRQARIEIEEIRDAMQARFGATTVSSLLGLAGGGLTAETTDMSVLTIASAAASFTLMAASAAAIASLHPNKERMLKRPMAYAVAARRLFRKPNVAPRRWAAGIRRDR